MSRSRLGSGLSVCNVGKGHLVCVQLESTFDRALVFLCRSLWDRGCIVSWGILWQGSVNSLVFLRRTYNLLGRPEIRGLLDSQCISVPHPRCLCQWARCFVLHRNFPTSEVPTVLVLLEDKGSVGRFIWARDGFRLMKVSCCLWKGWVELYGGRRDKSPVVLRLICVGIVARWVGSGCGTSWIRRGVPKGCCIPRRAIQYLLQVW